jgi:uncharacterized Fe-S cluster protein YjdI
MMPKVDEKSKRIALRRWKMALQVNWDSKVCIHSGNCVKTLPEVFRVEHGKFVIDPAAASEERVKAAVAACPSKALKIRAQ